MLEISADQQNHCKNLVVLLFHWTVPFTYSSVLSDIIAYNTSLGQK